LNKSILIKTILTILIFSIIGIYIAYRVYLQPDGIDINKSKYPVTGIDISKHNGKVDFKQIRKQNIDFVYIKATEGGDYNDINFETNYRNAVLSGLPVSAYHFFTFKVEGKKQAENLLRAIKGKHMDLPLVLDVEEWGNSEEFEELKVIAEIQSCIDELEEKTDLRVMIYTNENGYRKFVKRNFEGNELWICSFNSEPKIGKKWTFWQHSHKGKLIGTEGLVDINTFNGNREEWNNYLKSNKEPEKQIIPMSVKKKSSR